MSFQTYVQRVVGQVLAAPLLQGFVDAAVYRIVTPGTYDPVTGTMTASTIQEVPVTVDTDSYQGNELIPDVVLSTDVKIMVQQREYPQKPSIQHTIVIDGVTYSIVGVTEDSPGITWTIQGRSAGVA